MKKLLIGVIVLLVVAGGVWFFLAQPGSSSAQVSPTVTATPLPSAPVSVGSTPTPDTRCIITIDGQRYDVSSFRSVHPGGDVFKCGTDMSAAFHAQHGAGARQLQQIQNLKIN